MAYEEYFDLYILAQENPNAPYYVVSFDTIGSQTMPIDKRNKLTKNILIIMKYVYEKLLIKEKELGKQIVIKDERFKRPWDKTSSWNGNYVDPAIHGDSFKFTVLRDTVTKEEIIELVNQCKKLLNMDEEFHVADGYYETNNYEEGRTKFYRGYCLQTLEGLHKTSVRNEIEKVQRRIRRTL